jgi:hypothetical protein
MLAQATKDCGSGRQRLSSTEISPPVWKVALPTRNYPTTWIPPLGYLWFVQLQLTVAYGLRKKVKPTARYCCFVGRSDMGMDDEASRSTTRNTRRPKSRLRGIGRHNDLLKQSGTTATWHFGNDVLSRVDPTVNQNHV